jgi:hypothetical protein
VDFERRGARAPSLETTQPKQPELRTMANMALLLEGSGGMTSRTAFVKRA